MGITISFKMAQEVQYIKKNIDEVERIAKEIKKEQADKLKIPFEIRRIDDTCLCIDIDGCETFALNFKPMAYWLEKQKPKPFGEGWNYQASSFEDLMWFEKQHQGEHYERWQGQKLVWSADFCKTQYATNILAHKWIADLLRIIASRCQLAMINDEGNYCHSGNLEDATNSIESLGKMINELGSTLNKSFGSENVVAGGETKIKSIRKQKRI